MAADRTGRWDLVRQALGRLAGRVSTHSLPEAQTGITVKICHLEATEFAEILPGARQEEWRATPVIQDLPAPVAIAGGSGIDPSAVSTVIGADRTLGAATTGVAEAACRFAQVVAHLWAPGLNAPDAPSDRCPPVQFDKATTRQAGIVLGPAVTRPVAIAQSVPSTPKSHAPAGWLIKPTRVRAGLAPVLRIPILCPRLVTASGMGAFALERSLLATAVDVPEADVVLIGVFPRVPLGAVQKLSVTPDGAALQIWVRPDAGGRSAGTVTVVLGRQRSTGRMLQAVHRGGASTK